MNRVGGDGSLLRRINGVAVLRALRGADVLTLRDLADQAGISRNTAEDAVLALVDGGLAAEVAPTDSGQRPIGRPAKRYCFRADGGHVLGVDFAVHEINILITDLRGTEISRYRADADTDASADTRVEQARVAIREAVRTARISAASVLAMCVATTGIVSPDGRVVRSERLPAMQGHDLTKDLAVLGDVPVIIGNDARLAAIAERWRGAATDTLNFVNILAGRSITAGVVLDGRLLFGTHGAAGEIGILREAGWRAALAEMDDWPNPREHIFAAATNGDADALARVDAIASKLATGIAAMVLAVDPERVVLAGGLARTGQTLLTPLQRHLDAQTLFHVPIHLSQLDHEAVAIGAVRTALDHVETILFDTNSPRLTALFAG